jgi:hypothetical protein
MNHSATRVCPCGHEFPKRKSPKKREPEPVVDEVPPPSFAAGLTIEGGLMITFPETGDWTALTPEQTAVVRKVLGAPQ